MHAEPSPTQPARPLVVARILLWSVGLFTLVLGVILLVSNASADATQNPPTVNVLDHTFVAVFSLVTGAGLIGLAEFLHVLSGFAGRLGPMHEPVASRTAPEPANPVAVDTTADQLADARRALRASEWEPAAALVRTFQDAHPDHPEAARIAAELAEARASTARDLQAKLQAAREANDPDRVIELRNALRPVLDPDVLLPLDRDLAKWLMAVVHKRLRGGTVRVDLATLAGKVAESFDATPEGASLRASLPTLRRAAGLCARCAQPYKGIADACPACLSGKPTATPDEPPVPEPI